MRGRNLAAAAVTGLVLIGGGGVAYAQTHDSSGSYRTAKVTLGDVDKTLNLSGTVTASARRDLSFGVAGAVRKINIKAGDTVSSGDVLATLDSTDLEAAVTRARASVAKARAQLESDQDSQAAAVAAAEASETTAEMPETSSEAAATGSGSSNAVSPALQAALAALATQQGAVTSAQTDATTAIVTAKTALAAQVAACRASLEPAEPATTDDTSLTEDCTEALDAVQAAQDEVASDQDTLQVALEALATTVSGAAATLQQSVSQATSQVPASSSSSSEESAAAAPANGSTDGGSSTGNAGGGGAVTAAGLAQDQASIDTASAELTEAKRTLEAAELTAPFSGTVLSVSTANGDAVGASDVVAVIVGDGGTTATTTVTTDQVPDVKTGQAAAVTPAGASEPVAGTVTSIGLLPDTSSGTAAYPVTIDLTGAVTAPEGSTASIALVTGTAKGALTVPSSAVSTAGRTTVSVLTDGTPVRTVVTVGVVGPSRTSITAGLKKDQEVVLADLSADLPSGDSTTTRLPGAGGAGFPGTAGGQPPGGQRAAS